MYTLYENDFYGVRFVASSNDMNELIDMIDNYISYFVENENGEVVLVV